MDQSMVYINHIINSRQLFLKFLKKQNFSFFVIDTVDNEAQSLFPFLNVKNGSSIINVFKKERDKEWRRVEFVSEFLHMTISSTRDKTNLSNNLPLQQILHASGQLFATLFRAQYFDFDDGDK